MIPGEGKGSYWPWPYYLGTWATHIHHEFRHQPGRSSQSQYPESTLRRPAAPRSVPFPLYATHSSLLWVACLRRLGGELRSLIGRIGSSAALSLCATVSYQPVAYLPLHLLICASCMHWAHTSILFSLYHTFLLSVWQLV